MGGQYEDTIKPTAKPATTPAAAGTEDASQTIQNIRFHLSGGEVHFHDDQNSLKVAVPVSDWYRAWELLRNPRASDTPGWYTASYTYTNPGLGTILVCESVVSAISKGGGAANVSIYIKKVTFDDAWLALEKFRNRGTK